MRLIVGISGASGVIYGIRLLQCLRDRSDVETHLVLSEAARQMIRMETSWSPEEVVDLADVVYDVGNLAAAISSGSYRVAGMIIAPCSIKTLSAIANSHNDNLLVRAADVCLKERRRLVLLVRETPLHLGHLELMARVSRTGGIILPPSPAFYNHPQTIDDIVNHTIGRAMDLVGIEHDLFPRWMGE